ncbi:MAG: CHASE2 domain-containing protein [Proteobacteria bacterium]|nr:CHASE2 domain-containing protein [Pseudomonadota bacterium]
MDGENIYKKLLSAISLFLAKIRLFPHYLDWRWWEREQKLSFLINICIGFALGIAFFFMTHLQYMENVFNSTVDKLIKKEAAAFLKTSEKCFKQPSQYKECKNIRNKISNHIVFIDIDSDTYSRWGEPLFIPRKQIAKFLRLADKNRAKVVYLDTIFDYPSNYPEEDAELRKCLENITKRKSELKIIFPTIKGIINNKIKKNIFDDVINKNPNFYRGFPYASFSKSDRVVRYIRYYDIAKGTDGENTVLWGVPVLSVALFTNDFPRLKALESKILDDFKYERTKKHIVGLSNNGLIEIGNNELFSNRIRFAFLPPGTLNSEGNLFAERILPDEVEALQQDLNDKIVIIGTSSPDKEGWYRTPVGDMAGIYIIGNAMNVLLGNWQVRDAPLWVGFLINLLVVIFACYMFVHFPPSTARIITVLFASILLTPITYYFYVEYGIFINTIFLFMNLVIPVMAMGWYRIQKTIKKIVPNTILRFLSRY